MNRQQQPGDRTGVSEPEEREALRQFRDRLYDKYGIYFPDKKFYQLKAKIQKRLRKLGINSIRAYDK
ncbi:MAG: hypothetical protein ABEJ65_10125, partial [bacterium]